MKNDKMQRVTCCRAWLKSLISMDMNFLSQTCFPGWQETHHFLPKAHDKKDHGFGGLYVPFSVSILPPNITADHHIIIQFLKDTGHRFSWWKPRMQPDLNFCDVYPFRKVKHLLRSHEFEGHDDVKDNLLCNFSLWCIYTVYCLTNTPIPCRPLQVCRCWKGWEEFNHWNKRVVNCSERVSFA